MKQQDEVAEILKTAYRKKKESNPRLSLGVLSRKLGISVPFLSQLLNGRRNLPATLVVEICASLDLDIEKRDFVIRSVLSGRNLPPNSILPEKAQPSRATRTPDFQYIPEKKFEVLSDWINLAILDATLIADFDGTAEFISRKLRLPIETVAERVERLLELELLQRSDAGLRKSGAYFDFHSNAKAMIRAYHASCLDKAKSEMFLRGSTEDLERRLITTYVMTADSAKVSEAKQRLKAFMDELMIDLSSGSDNELYQLSFQFLPLT